MRQLSLGIIGISEGNGHPYSWSAIFNGYNEKFMSQCPFQVIPEYLSRQSFPDDSIPDALVTHIWTQDKLISKQIAKASNIEFIVDHYKDLIGCVDGILLARDDFQNHYEMSKPFIEAGLPIYIDKPLAATIIDAKKIFDLEKFEGQVFTCSALGYAKEFFLTKKEINNIGEIKHVEACVSKSWSLYGIHIIEPVIRILSDFCFGFENEVVDFIKVISSGDRKIVSVKWNCGITATFSSMGNFLCPITIHLFGSKGYRELLFKDTFFAFKRSLKMFVDIIRKKEVCPSKSMILSIVNIIEQGLKNG